MRRMLLTALPLSLVLLTALPRDVAPILGPTLVHAEPQPEPLNEKVQKAIKAGREVPAAAEG